MAGKIYTIPLRREFQKASFKRKTNKAVKALKEYVVKHTKKEKVIVGEELNAHLWSQGITNPPPKVQVEITVDKDSAFVNLVGIAKKTISIEKKLGKASMKEKLAETVESLKGGKKEETKSAFEEPATTEKVTIPKATPVPDTSADKKDAPAKTKKPAEAKTQTKPAAASESKK